MAALAVAGVLVTQSGLPASAEGTSPADTAAAGRAPADQPDPRLARFHDQKITWHNCQLDAKDELGKSLDAVKAQCAEVTVPLDYTQPDGRTITVSISRRQATDRTGKLGTLFINTGGPGESKTGVTWVAGGFPPWIPKGSPQIASRYDLVAMDPRFMASSRGTALECGWPTGTSTSAGFVGPDRRSFERSVALNKDLAARCAKYKDVLPHVSTRNMARDLDVIRAALGAEKLSYLGWSYGSILGAVYTQLFPDHLDRVVLDSSVNPDTWGPNADRDNAPVKTAALRPWAAWVARHDRTYHLGTTPAQVLAAFDRFRQVADQDRTLQIGRHRVNANTLRSIGIGPDPDDLTSYSGWTDIAKLFLNAARGRKVTPSPQDDEFLAVLSSTEVAAGSSASLATSCADRAVSRDPETYYRDIQAHRSEGFYGPPGRNVTPCTFWPASPAEPASVIHNDHPILIVGSDQDTTTPYSGQLAMHRALTGSRMVTLKGSGGHAVYLAYHGAPCVDTTVDRYLLDGVLPANDLICAKGKPAAPGKATKG